jgi:hypothetical protein
VNWKVKFNNSFGLNIAPKGEFRVEKRAAFFHELAVRKH